MPIEDSARLEERRGLFSPIDEDAAALERLDPLFLQAAEEIKQRPFPYSFIKSAQFEQLSLQEPVGVDLIFHPAGRDEGGGHLR